MNNWNFDMSTALRGTTRIVARKIGDNIAEVSTHETQKVILAGKCGVVTSSYWIEAEQRWCMFSANEEPIAWMPWPDSPVEVPA